MYPHVARSECPAMCYVTNERYLFTGKTPLVK